MVKWHDTYASNATSSLGDLLEQPYALPRIEHSLVNYYVNLLLLCFEQVVDSLHFFALF
jgi:hypothetical protein